VPRGLQRPFPRIRGRRCGPLSCPPDVRGRIAVRCSGQWRREATVDRSSCGTHAGHLPWSHDRDAPLLALVPGRNCRDRLLHRRLLPATIVPSAVGAGHRHGRGARRRHHRVRPDPLRREDRGVRALRRQAPAVRAEGAARRLRQRWPDGRRGARLRSGCGLRSGRALLCGAILGRNRTARAHVRPGALPGCDRVQAGDGLSGRVGLRPAGGFGRHALRAGDERSRLRQRALRRRDTGLLLGLHEKPRGVHGGAWAERGMHGRRRESDSVSWSE